MHATIAIPTYNRADWIGESLDSIFELTVPAGLSVDLVVVDNNSTDDTAAVVDRRIAASPFPMRRVFEEQQGLCFGRNRALAEARGEHLILLDDDISVGRDWLVGYVAAVNEQQADCVVGPVFPRFLSQTPDYATESVLKKISSGYSRKGDHPIVLPPETAHEVPGCNFGFRVEAGRAIDGFDPTLDRIGSQMLSGGDTDFGRRLAAAGRRTVYRPECRIDHVIVPEKLTKPYLRKRAYGSGVTLARLRQRRVRWMPRLREIRELIKLSGQAACDRLLGRQRAFESELLLRERLGFYFQ